MPAEKTKITIAFRDGADVASALAEAARLGFQLEQRLSTLNMAIGYIERSKIPSLSSIAGIGAAEPEETVHILPADNSGGAR